MVTISAEDEPDRVYVQSTTGRTIFALEGNYCVYYWFADNDQHQFVLNRQEFHKWLAENNYFCMN